MKQCKKMTIVLAAANGATAIRPSAPKGAGSSPPSPPAPPSKPPSSRPKTLEEALDTHWFSAYLTYLENCAHPSSGKEFDACHTKCLEIAQKLVEGEPTLRKNAYDQLSTLDQKRLRDAYKRYCNEMNQTMNLSHIEKGVARAKENRALLKKRVEAKKRGMAAAEAHPDDADAEVADDGTLTKHFAEGGQVFVDGLRQEGKLEEASKVEIEGLETEQQKAKDWTAAFLGNGTSEQQAENLGGAAAAATEQDGAEVHVTDAGQPQGRTWVGFARDFGPRKGRTWGAYLGLEKGPVDAANGASAIRSSAPQGAGSSPPSTPPNPNAVPESLFDAIGTPALSNFINHLGSQSDVLCAWKLLNCPEQLSDDEKRNWVRQKLPGTYLNLIGMYRRYAKEPAITKNRELCEAKKAAADAHPDDADAGVADDGRLTKPFAEGGQVFVNGLRQEGNREEASKVKIEESATEQQKAHAAAAAFLGNGTSEQQAENVGGAAADELTLEGQGAATEQDGAEVHATDAGQPQGRTLLEFARDFFPRRDRTWGEYFGRGQGPVDDPQSTTRSTSTVPAAQAEEDNTDAHEDIKRSLGQSAQVKADVAREQAQPAHEQAQVSLPVAQQLVPDVNPPPTPPVLDDDTMTAREAATRDSDHAFMQGGAAVQPMTNPHQAPHDQAVCQPQNIWLTHQEEAAQTPFSTVYDRSEPNAAYIHRVPQIDVNEEVLDEELAGAFSSSE